MTVNIRKSVQRDGFVIIPKIFDEDQLNELEDTIQLHVKYYASVNGLDFDNDDTDFHAALIRLRKSRPDVTARLYDTLQTNAILRRIIISSEVTRLAAAVLNVSPSGLSATGEMIRLDYPAPPTTTINPAIRSRGIRSALTTRKTEMAEMVWLHGHHWKMPVPGMAAWRYVRAVIVTALLK